MRLTWELIHANAIAVSKSWKDAKNEETEAQSFVTDFLRVFGVDEPLSVGGFEYKLQLSGGRTGYLDYVWKDKIAIGMNSRGKDLARIFPTVSTDAAQSGISTALRLFGRLDILPNMSALPAQRATCILPVESISTPAYAASVRNGMKYPG